MKYIKYLFCLLVLPAMIISCGDFDDDNLDFSNSVDAYVEFNSPGSITVDLGQSVELSVVIRSVIQSDLIIDYSVDGVEGFQTTIPANSFSTTISLPGLDEEGQAVVVLDKAVSAEGEVFSIGRGDAGIGLSTTQVTINWVEPDEG